MNLAIAQVPDCVEIDAGGTVSLPPASCAYVSPDEVHMIIDGLPPGTTIEIGAEHFEFFNIQRQPDPAGGEIETFDSFLQLTLTGTGDLAGFNRNLGLQVVCEVHTGPRTPGDPVQTFPNEMVRLQGELVGDPDFDQLRIIAGSDNGLPSPGQTTLTRLPDGNFNVDSFFDIAYQIEFVGAPGGMLDGLAGTTAGTVRMRTGNSVEPLFTLTAAAPSLVQGNPGSTVQFGATLSLTSDNISTTDGALGWATGTASEGCSIVDAKPSAEVDALLASCPGTTFVHIERTSGAGNEGVIYSVALCLDPGPDPVTLPPTGTTTILDLTVEATVPPSTSSEDCAMARLVPRDGLKGSGDPVINRIVYRGSSFPAKLVGTTIKICKRIPGQVPGDCNQDGLVDIADPICIALILFFNIPPNKFPCGDGSATHASNLRLLDWNGDGTIDLTDIIASLRHMFLGAADHVLGPNCVPIRECPDVCEPPQVPPADTPEGIDDFPSVMGLNLVDDAGNIIPGAAPLIFRGPTSIVLGEPFLNADGHWTVPTEMVQLDMTDGTGIQKIVLSAAMPSLGEIVSQQGPDGPFFPCDSFFDVFVEIDLPGLFSAPAVNVRVEANNQTEVPGCDCYRTPENFHAENPGAGPNLAGGHLPCPPGCPQENCRDDLTANPCP